MATCLSREFPCYETNYNSFGAGSPSINGLTLLAYKVQNPYASQTIAQLGVLGYSGSAKVTAAVYSRSGALIQQSNTITNIGGNWPMVFTFASPVVITDSWYWVALCWEASGSSVVVVPNSTAQGVLDAFSNQGIAYSVSSPAATQPGGTGTAITMPSTLGTATRLTGASSWLPFLVKVTD